MLNIAISNFRKNNAGKRLKTVIFGTFFTLLKFKFARTLNL